jgi:hypothetical protein
MYLEKNVTSISGVEYFCLINIKDTVLFLTLYNNKDEYLQDYHPIYKITTTFEHRNLINIVKTLINIFENTNQDAIYKMWNNWNGDCTI